VVGVTAVDRFVDIGGTGHGAAIRLGQEAIRRRPTAPGHGEALCGTRLPMNSAWLTGSA
jgi:hypothetical protein